MRAPRPRTRWFDLALGRETDVQRDVDEETVIALVAGRLVQPMLFETSSRDPIVYGAVLLLLAVISLGATALPGARAASVDPGIALRGD